MRDVYERYGFEPLETPAVENIETLLGKYGEEGNKLIFKILKRGEHEASGEADLALRYDLTVPLARVVAEYQAKLPKFFKRYQIQPVWRADRPARGRFREFYQCDIDAIGSTSPRGRGRAVRRGERGAGAARVRGLRDPAEPPPAADRAARAAGVPPAEHGDALVALDKLDKIGADGVARELSGRGIGRGAPPRASSSSGRPAGPHHAGRPGGRRDASSTAATPGLSRPRRARRDRAPPRRHAACGRIRFDPSLARGLSYYTGAIMEIAVPDLAGSLGGGGRYDNLIGMFLGRDVPACGFSLGLERIIVVMDGAGDVSRRRSSRASADVMVTLWNDERRGPMRWRWRRELRAGGLRVDVYPGGRQAREAVQVRGQPERAARGDPRRRRAGRGDVTVKDLRTGEQQRVAPDTLVAHVTRPGQTRLPRSRWTARR